MTGFEIDPEKDAINRRKHLLPLAFGVFVFDDSYIEEEDTRFDYGETRFVAIGPIAGTGDRLYSVTYTWRGIRRRLISVRKASVREIRKYRRSHP